MYKIFDLWKSGKTCSFWKWIPITFRKEVRYHLKVGTSMWTSLFQVELFISVLFILIRGGKKKSFSCFQRTVWKNKNFAIVWKMCSEKLIVECRISRNFLKKCFERVNFFNLHTVERNVEIPLSSCSQVTYLTCCHDRYIILFVFKNECNTLITFITLSYVKWKGNMQFAVLFWNWFHVKWKASQIWN